MEQFQKCKVGQEIEVKYLGRSKLGKLLLGKCDTPDDENDETERFNNYHLDYEQ
jgi:hypothetical protein